MKRKKGSAKIIRRRGQMLVHSYLYYHCDTSLISDDTWQEWANDLVALQEKYGTEFDYFDEEFADWDGSTGCHLPHPKKIEETAHRLMEYRLSKW